jgi:hypothetical protein
MAMEDEDCFAANAEKSEASQAQAFDELLTRVAVKVVDKKHYPADVIDVDVFLSGDRTKYLIDVRNDAFGPEIEVRRQCPRGHEIEQVLDLSCLPIWELPAASAAALAGRKPLVFTLPRSGREVKWQMLTGHLETAILEAVNNNPDDSVTEGVAVRIVEIEGFDEHGLDKETGQDLRGWLKKVHTRDSRALRQHIANNECGVNTVVTIPCKRSGCHEKVEVNVLLEADFFPLVVQREDSTDSSDS